MNYIKASDVFRPEGDIDKEGWDFNSNLPNSGVLFDGGENIPGHSIGYSLRVGHYFKNGKEYPSIGLRWNGVNNPDPAVNTGTFGFPLSSAKAAWIVVPEIDGLYKLLLDSIPDDKLSQSDKLEFYKFLVKDDPAMNPPRKSIFSPNQKEYIARTLQSFAVASIIALVTAMSGRLELSKLEISGLAIAAIATSIYGFILRKE